MSDPKLFSLLAQEVRRQNTTLNLTASENIVSRDVLAVLGSPLTNKYAEGYSKLRYYGGNEYVDQIEELCIERARSVFGLSAARWHVNVQPYSGSPANLAVYLALVPFGKKIMGLALDMGGHLTHGHRVSITGKAWKSVSYGVDRKTERLDYTALARQVRKEKPYLIIAGYTAYPRAVDFKKFKTIADSVGAYLLVDMSHIAGLVAGGVHQSPFPYADVVTTTTHKTLRGPRGAMIFANRASRAARTRGIDIAQAIDRAVFPGLQGGPHANQIAATAVALREASTPAFRRYAHQVVANAQALAEVLAAHELRLVSGGTDTHLVLVDLSPLGITGKQASDRLERDGIIVNKNTIPYDSHTPANPSGIRLGTPTLTTRGMKEKEMQEIAHLIIGSLAGETSVAARAARLAKRFPIRT